MKELNSNHGKYEFFSGQNFRKMKTLPNLGVSFVVMCFE